MNVNQMFRYLNIGLPDDIYRRKVAGDFCGAIRLIDRRLDMGNLPEPLRYSLIVQREICRRMPADYPYTREEALSVLREKVPDFTDEEFDRCVEEGKIGWIYVNGRMRFFNRFFASMCKTDPGFAVRAGVMLPGVESAVSSFGGKNRLDYCVHQIKEKGILKNRIRIRASVRMKDECFTPGVFVRVHLPIPAACEQQSDIVIEKMEPPCGKIAPQDALQRTICFEETMKENHSFSVVYSYVYTASYHDTEKMHGEGKQPDFFTQEEPPHIVFTPQITPFSTQISVTSSCQIWSPSMCSRIPRQVVMNLARSHCALGLHMAGPFERLSIRNCMAVASVTMPVKPPNASISLTICPFAMPPIAGLQLIWAILFMSIVMRQVFAPIRAAAAAASQPA